MKTRRLKQIRRGRHPARRKWVGTGYVPEGESLKATIGLMDPYYLEGGVANWHGMSRTKEEHNESGQDGAPKKRRITVIVEDVV